MNKQLLAAAMTSWLGIGLGSASAVLAQAPEEALPPATATDEIPTVVVTANRRAENLEKVSASITALDADRLAEQGIVTQADLQAAVPGLTVRQTQGSNSLTLAIRGQTIDAFTGSKTAVVPYFNEVQLNSGGAATFYDLESIQVLKGPQGTLFGRNATGGAVLYTAAKPKEELGGYLKLRGGSYQLTEAQGALNLPLSGNTLLMRIAADVIHQDGFQHNLYDGRDLGEVARQSGRISLLWRPSEALENSTLIAVDHVGGNSTATRLKTVNRCGSSNGGYALTCAADFLFNPATWTGGSVWTDYVAAHPKVNPDGIAAYLDQDSPGLGFWKANEVAPVHHNEQDYFFANTTSYQLGEDLLLKNIVGASLANTHDLGSSVGAPYGVFYSANLDQNRFGNQVRNLSYSDELQLQGKALHKALTYILGAYYQKEATDTLFPQVYFDLSPDSPGFSTNSHFKIKDETPAAFAQGSYDLGTLGLRGLSVTAGFRYTWESVDIAHLSDGANAGNPDQSARYSNPSWNLGLSYQATDDLLLYLQGRRSWRAGGFNGTAPPSIDPGNGDPVIRNVNLFKPEFVHDVEIGAKYAGTLFGRPLRANLALYNQWIKNVQRAEFPDPPGPLASIAYTVNVPEAQISGAELDFMIKPVSWMEAGFAGAMTYARFKDGQNTADVFGVTYVFGPYADVPRASASLYGTVFLPTPTSWGPMSLRTDLYAQTGMYFSNNNSTITPDTRIPGYGLVNLRYDWSEIRGSKYSVSAYVRNFADKEYYTGGFALSASLGVNSVAVGTPRMFGAELRYAF